MLADTLIVWTEPDGTEIALSFQDPAACANICEFIGEVQTHLTLVSGRAFPFRDIVEYMLSGPHALLQQTNMPRCPPRHLLQHLLLRLLQNNHRQDMWNGNRRAGHLWTSTISSQSFAAVSNPAVTYLRFHREQSESLRASTRSIAGREKTVEFVLSNVCWNRCITRDTAD